MWRVLAIVSIFCCFLSIPTTIIIIVNQIELMHNYHVTPPINVNKSNRSQNTLFCIIIIYFPSFYVDSWQKRDSKMTAAFKKFLLTGFNSIIARISVMNRKTILQLCKILDTQVTNLQTAWMNQVKFFKSCLPQILLGLFLNTLSHI